MAVLPESVITVAGAVPTYTAVTASDTAKCGPNKVLHVKNGGAGATVVTPTVRGKLKGQTPTVAATSVPAGGDRFILLVPELFADGNGDATLAFSVLTTVTAAVFNAADVN